MSEEPRPVSLSQLRQYLRESLELQGVNHQALDEGSRHPYRCVCPTCWEWWKLMGLGEETHPPFTQAQIDCATYAEAMQLGGDPVL